MIMNQDNTCKCSTVTAWVQRPSTASSAAPRRVYCSGSNNNDNNNDNNKETYNNDNDNINNYNSNTIL